ncbi:C4-dicarboxylate ABC transporter [Flavobacterium antarcticum]
MTDNNNKIKRVQKSPKVRFLLVLGIVFFLIYFVLGITVIFWKDFPIDMSKTYRIAFGVLLIAYAFFRFIRLIKNDKE